MMSQQFGLPLKRAPNSSTSRRKPSTPVSEAERQTAMRISEAAQAPLFGAQPAPKAESAAEKIARWREELGAVVIPEKPEYKPLERLLAVSLAFLDSALLREAIAAGWSEVEIWGVFRGDIRAQLCRFECQGLVPGLAWSRLSIRLAHVLPDTAMINVIATDKVGKPLKGEDGKPIVTGGLTHRRRPDVAGEMIVWWKGIANAEQR